MSFTYFSKKTACIENSKQFAQKMKSDLNSCLIHLNTMKAQYRKIREVKTKVLDGSSRSKFNRIDWSKNVKLNQTEQEKCQYYTALSGTINMFFMTKTSLKVSPASAM